ncbi:unnamed protein product [Symbiodinium natans]|uniref:EF-hand domain-containing protein n=1 Tax=Symbiodinium natans TaxID=878477 RepID=A0A812V7V3_9DINO|nr:unnamed protein product [Symbiodinium natans]
MEGSEEGFRGHKLLNEAIQRHGGFAWQPKRHKSAHVQGSAGGPKSGGNDTLRAGRPRARQNRRHSNTVRTVADLMRSWSSYKCHRAEDSEPNRDEQRLLHQSGKEGGDFALHSKVLSGLGALGERLHDELDLTFKETRQVDQYDWDFADTVRDSELLQAGVRMGEEVAISLEMQGTVRTQYGKAHSVLLRAPWAFALRPKNALLPELHSSSATPRGSTRPTTPATPVPALLDGRRSPETSIGAASRWSDGERKAPPPRMMGDNCQVVSICLQERVPETLLLQRLHASCSADSSETQGGCSPNTSKPKLQASEWLRSVNDSCAHLEAMFSTKLDQHSQVCSEEVQEIEASQAGEEDALEAPTRSVPPNCRMEDYLRDLRHVIRLISPGLPTAARLLEGVVKGAVMAFDAELHVAHLELAKRKARLGSLAEARSEIDQLRTELATLQQQNRELKKQLNMADEIKQAEIRTYQEKVDKLKDELGRLHPDDGSLEGVAHIMDKCANLLLDLEEESAVQTKILQDMGEYTAHIVQETDDLDPSKIQLHRPGRVIELPNGELQLRPYSVAEQSTQVIETDLLKVDPELPVKYRPPGLRSILANFQGREVRKMTVKELESEIDRLYTAKASADAEADAAHLPRSELPAFIVEHYLEQLGTVTAAQEKLCGIMACIRSLERTAHLAPPSLKVQLFARFLQYCTCNQALPLPVLDVALRAKRLANASGGRQKTDTSSMTINKLANMAPSPRGGRIGHSAARGEESEVHLSIPNAWDSATKALPFGGTVISRRELFMSLMKFATFPEDVRHPQADMNDFFFLLLILHDRLRREAAPKLRMLIAKVENRGTVTCDEFRDALRDAQILGIDDAIWRSKLCPPAALGNQASLSEGLVLEFLGGGSQSKLIKGYVTESQLLWATVEAVAAELHDRVEALRKINRTQKIDDKNHDERICRLNYGDFKSLIQSSDPSISNSAIRSLFIASVEASRSCFQYEGDACPVTGALDAAPSLLYGADIVTLQHMGLAVVRTLMKDNATEWSAGGKLAPAVDNKSVDNSPAMSAASGTSQRPSFQQVKSPSSSARGMKPPRLTR